MKFPAILMLIIFHINSYCQDISFERLDFSESSIRYIQSDGNGNLYLMSNSNPRRLFVNYQSDNEWTEITEYILPNEIGIPAYSVEFGDNGYFVRGLSDIYFFDRNHNFLKVLSPEKSIISAKYNQDKLVFSDSENYYITEDQGINFDTIPTQRDYTVSGLSFSEDTIYQFMTNGLKSWLFRLDDQFEISDSIEVDRGNYTNANLYLMDYIYILRLGELRKIDYGFENFERITMTNNLTPLVLTDNLVYLSSNVSGEFKVFYTPLDELDSEPVSIISFDTFASIIKTSSSGVHIYTQDSIFSFSEASNSIEEIDFDIPTHSFLKFEKILDTLYLHTHNRLFFSNRNGSWKNIKIDDATHFWNFWKSSDNIILQEARTGGSSGLDDKYFNYDSLTNIKGRLFSTGLDSFVVLRELCGDFGNPSAHIYESGNQWVEHSFDKCFPFDGNEVIHNDRLYIYDETFQVQPSPISTTWTRHWATWFDLKDYSSGYINPHPDIPYVEASVLITEDGIVYINPILPSDNNQPSFVSYDLGDSYIELGATPFGRVYEALEGGTFVSSNSHNNSTLFYRKEIDTDYTELSTEPLSIRPIDHIIVDDGDIYLATDYGEIYRGSFLVSNSNITPSNFSVDVYPNPMTSEVRIRSNEKLENCELKVFNAQGKLLLHNSKIPNVVSMSDYPSGIYFFNFSTNDDDSSIRKIVKL